MLCAALRFVLRSSRPSRRQQEVSKDGRSIDGWRSVGCFGAVPAISKCISREAGQTFCKSCKQLLDLLPGCALTGQLRHHRLVSSRAEEVTASCPKFIANISDSLVSEPCLRLLALEEGIPEDAPEYGPARNEARFGIGIDLQKSTELRYRFGSPSRSTNGLDLSFAFGCLDYLTISKLWFETCDSLRPLETLGFWVKWSADRLDPHSLMMSSLRESTFECHAKWWYRILQTTEAQCSFLECGSCFGKILHYGRRWCNQRFRKFEAYWPYWHSPAALQHVAVWNQTELRLLKGSVKERFTFQSTDVLVLFKLSKSMETDIQLNRWHFGTHDKSILNPFL